MKLVQHPDPCLTQVCAKYGLDQIVHGDLKNIGLEMLKIMRANAGIGLAGPQVGIMSRIIVAMYGSMELMLANPEFEPNTESGTVRSQEGCLSYPGRVVFVERWRKGRVTGWDLMGDKPQITSFKASNMLARIIQHETDHLDGVCKVAKPTRERATA